MHWCRHICTLFAFVNGIFENDPVFLSFLLIGQQSQRKWAKANSQFGQSDQLPCHSQFRGKWGVLTPDPCGPLTIRLPPTRPCRPELLTETSWSDDGSRSVLSTAVPRAIRPQTHLNILHLEGICGPLGELTKGEGKPRHKLGNNFCRMAPLKSEMGAFR